MATTLMYDRQIPMKLKRKSDILLKLIHEYTIKGGIESIVTIELVENQLVIWQNKKMMKTTWERKYSDLSI